MANFKAWKRYMLCLIDRAIESHGLQGPFVDVGCGPGDVSRHLAERSWPGVALDSSEDADRIARRTLAGFPTVRVVHGDVRATALGPCRTMLFMDVVEHVRDDEEFLRDATRSLEPGGHAIITVPVNPDEWRWDDAFYGHYRRYQPEAFRELLDRAGFDVLEDWDCSFPLFWAMRRAFTRFMSAPAADGERPEAKTARSAQRSAWTRWPLSDVIDRFFLATRLYLLHLPFRNGRWGCERLFVARKRGPVQPADLRQ